MGCLAGALGSVWVEGRDGDVGEEKAFRELRWEGGLDPVGVCGALRRASRSNCADGLPFRDDRACDRWLSPLSPFPAGMCRVGDACEASDVADMGCRLSAESGVNGPTGVFWG